MPNSHFETLPRVNAPNFTNRQQQASGKPPIHTFTLTNQRRNIVEPALGLLHTNHEPEPAPHLLHISDKPAPQHPRTSVAAPPHEPLSTRRLLLSHEPAPLTSSPQPRTTIDISSTASPSEQHLPQPTQVETSYFHIF